MWARAEANRRWPPFSPYETRGIAARTQPTDARETEASTSGLAATAPRWGPGNDEPPAVLTALPLCAPAAAARRAGAARQRIHQARAVTTHMLIVQTRAAALPTNCSAEAPGAFLLPGNPSRRRGLPAPAQPIIASRSNGRWARAAYYLRQPERIDAAVRLRACQLRPTFRVPWRSSEPAFRLQLYGWPRTRQRAAASVWPGPPDQWAVHSGSLGQDPGIAPRPGHRPAIIWNAAPRRFLLPLAPEIVQLARH
jgi:hypothetical protein